MRKCCLKSKSPRHLVQADSLHWRFELQRDICFGVQSGSDDVFAIASSKPDWTSNSATYRSIKLLSAKVKGKESNMRIKSAEFVKGGFYHIYNHASQNLNLFKGEDDYRTCMSLIKQYMGSPEFSMIAYCLMPNHYHFLVKQNGERPVFEALNLVWYRYSRYFNKKHQGKGSIFAGRMQHIAVDRDEYLHRLLEYIHMNPVTAGLVDSVQDWKWSNYPEWAGLRYTELLDTKIRDEMWKDVSNYVGLLNEMAEDKKSRKYLLD